MRWLFLWSLLLKDIPSPITCYKVEIHLTSMCLSAANSVLFFFLHVRAVVIDNWVICPPSQYIHEKAMYKNGFKQTFEVPPPVNSISLQSSYLLGENETGRLYDLPLWNHNTLGHADCGAVTRLWGFGQCTMTNKARWSSLAVILQWEECPRKKN